MGWDKPARMSSSTWGWWRQTHGRWPINGAALSVIYTAYRNDEVRYSEAGVHGCSQIGIDIAFAIRLYKKKTTRCFLEQVKQR
jgi:hypothetical protein